MPRSHRHFLPGLIWHITHRCHQQAFQLKFARDRLRWRHWLFESRRRHGLCVLDYIVTSNHVHLLVRDRGNGEIARSMQLIAARTAQEFNQRKSRKGAFWEDRYHATAVETGDHLVRCLVYIDLNMVRAGAVTHPMQWPDAGYHEIQSPRRHHRVVDLAALMEVLGVSELDALQQHHQKWVDTALSEGPMQRDERWTQSLAIGSEDYVNDVLVRLGRRASGRRVYWREDDAVLRETAERYESDFNAEN